MQELYREYQQLLERLCRRREKLRRECGETGRRLSAIETEIDELEESMMRMRVYL